MLSEIRKLKDELKNFKDKLLSNFSRSDYHELKTIKEKEEYIYKNRYNLMENKYDTEIVRDDMSSFSEDFLLKHKEFLFVGSGEFLGSDFLKSEWSDDFLIKILDKVDILHLVWGQRKISNKLLDAIIKELDNQNQNDQYNSNVFQGIARIKNFTIEEWKKYKKYIHISYINPSIITDGVLDTNISSVDWDKISARKGSREFFNKYKDHLDKKIFLKNNPEFLNDNEVMLERFREYKYKEDIYRHSNSTYAKSTRVMEESLKNSKITKIMKELEEYGLKIDYDYDEKSIIYEDFNSLEKKIEKIKSKYGKRKDIKIDNKKLKDFLKIKKIYKDGGLKTLSYIKEEEDKIAILKEFDPHGYEKLLKEENNEKVNISEYTNSKDMFSL